MHVWKSWSSAFLWRFGRSRYFTTESASQDPRLRLILGVGRSGTTWTARVLGQTCTPTRLIQEPLFWMRPRLHLAAGYDHTAIPMASRLASQHRLLAAYRELTADTNVILRAGVRQLDRNDDDWQVCIVKEVHALLASEAIVHAFGLPTVLVVRDPVATADSILRTNGMNQEYLVAEATHSLVTCHCWAGSFGRRTTADQSGILWC